MAFKNAVLAVNPDLGAGEVIKQSPHNISAFDVFQDGLLAGRFAQLKAGVPSNMDGTATPKLIGIPRRKVTGEIASQSAYTLTSEGFDSVAEIINFGFATVEIADGAEPVKYGVVNVINEAANAQNGRATDAAIAAGIISAGDMVFWEAKAAGVWLVRFNKYL